MQPLVRLLLQSLRHAAIGVAVVAVLLASFRAHMHQVGSDGCGHAITAWSIQGMVFTDVADPQLPEQDDSGAGICECPSSAVTTMESDAMVLPMMISAMVRVAHPVMSPDSPSYPPDPPPAQLG